MPAAPATADGSALRAAVGADRLFCVRLGRQCAFRISCGTSLAAARDRPGALPWSAGDYRGFGLLGGRLIRRAGLRHIPRPHRRVQRDLHSGHPAYSPSHY
jgi:hypothetical protein